MGLLRWLFGSRRSTSADAHRSTALARGRFGEDRHKPSGDWVQTTVVVKVAGVQHRRAAAIDFANRVAAIEGSSTLYGVRLRPEPSNPYDRNAIAVDGFVGDRVWHLGFLDRETAREIVEDLVCRGVPIAALLYAIYVGGDGYIDISVIVLAPPGNGTKARLKRRS